MRFIIILWSLFHVVVSVSSPTKEGTSSDTGPYFPEPGPKNITVSEGEDAYLPCVVEQLGDHVAWVRKRDWHLLTGGRSTYTSDPRISVVTNFEINSWTLLIRYTRVRDAGPYQCETSTLTSIVNLEVLPDPRPTLTLGSNVEADNVMEGIDIYFQCKFKPNHPHYNITWKKDGNLLTQDLTKGVIMTNASLVLQNIDRSDSGNYICRTHDGISNPVVLTVKYKPRPKLSLGRNLEAENITEGDDVHLECSAEANPSPYEFSWYHDGNFLSRKINRRVKRIRNTLTLPNVNNNHSGVYTCEAYNNIGRGISNPVILKVKSSSEPETGGSRGLSNQSGPELHTTPKAHLIAQAELLDKEHSHLSELFRNLLDKSKQKFNRMMTRTYGLMFTKNSTIYESIYESVSEIFDKGDKNMEAVIDHFFKRMFRNLVVLVNPQYQFDEGYLDCSSNLYEVLRPFGDEDEMTKTKIRTSVSPLRAYVQSLSTAASIIKNISKVESERSCKAKLNGTELHIHELCFEDHFPRIELFWQEFADAMTSLSSVFRPSSRIAEMLDEMYFRVSSSMMNLQEHLPGINKKIFEMCGKPNLLLRRKRSSGSYVAKRFSVPMDSNQLYTLSEDMNKQIELVDRMLSESKQLWAKLESEMCGSDCRSHQECSRIENTFPNSVIEEQITRLKFATLSLWKTYYHDMPGVGSPDSKAFALRRKLCPEEFVFYRGLCLWVNVFPKPWRSANRICKQRDSHLVRFHSNRRFLEKLQGFLNEQGIGRWNYWTGRPKGGRSDYQQVKMDIPRWFLNGRKVVNGEMGNKTKRDCYFLHFDDFTPFKSWDCNDRAGFICQWG